MNRIIKQSRRTIRKAAKREHEEDLAILNKLNVKYTNRKTLTGYEKDKLKHIGARKKSIK